MATADRKVHVLIVDDEAPIRKFLDRALVKAGYDTIVANDAADALAVVSSAAPIDLLVTDVMMPDISGDELARQARQLRPDLKVLYLTGFADQLFMERHVLWEGESFVEKPITMTGVEEAVSLALFGHMRGPERAAGAGGS